MPDMFIESFKTMKNGEIFKQVEHGALAMKIDEDEAVYLTSTPLDSNESPQAVRGTKFKIAEKVDVQRFLHRVSFQLYVVEPAPTASKPIDSEAEIEF